MPSGMEGAAAAVLDGKLYVLGGSTASSGMATVVFDLVYIYDPAVDSWSVGPPMAAPRYGAAATVHGQTIVMAGGYDESGPITSVEALAALRGPACNDGQTCTQGESCQSGTCQASGQFPPILNLAVEPLGQLGGTASLARDINASGQAVGAATVRFRAVARILEEPGKRDGGPRKPARLARTQFGIRDQ